MSSDFSTGAVRIFQQSPTVFEKAAQLRCRAAFLFSPERGLRQPPPRSPRRLGRRSRSGRYPPSPLLRTLQESRSCDRRPRPTALIPPEMPHPSSGPYLLAPVHAKDAKSSRRDRGGVKQLRDSAPRASVLQPAAARPAIRRDSKPPRPNKSRARQIRRFRSQFCRIRRSFSR